jgi:predicted oxidoreductase
MTNKFSPIVQGCMGWGAWGAKLTTQQMAKQINQAVEMGLTTFDHADIYGDYTTEADFGKALKASGIKREQLQLISKCGIQYVGSTRNNTIKHYQYDADYIVWSAERSLRDLGVSYLDLFLLHRPSPLMQADQIALAVDKLRSEGKIRSFGLSNFTPWQTDLIRQKVPVEANQIEYSLTAHQAMWDGSLDHMQINGIRPMAWSPLGSFFGQDSPQAQRISKSLTALSKKYGATSDQLLLAWILKHPAGILPVIGTSSVERMKLASQAPGIQLEDTDWFELLVASQGHKVA